MTDQERELTAQLQVLAAEALADRLQVLADEARAAAEACDHSFWRPSERERQLRVRSDVLRRAAAELRDPVG